MGEMELSKSKISNRSGGVQFVELNKLKPGDKVAVLSPSFGAPAQWPHVYELGLERLRNMFELEPVAYPTTTAKGAKAEKRKEDLEAAFRNPEIKAVIATLGGDDQVEYVKTIDSMCLRSNPKPFFGYSDNTHLANMLWLNGIPSFYGGSLFGEFAMQGHMDQLTVEYLRHALFDHGEFELKAAEEFNAIWLNWDEPDLLSRRREYEPNEGWYFDGSRDARGISWGGCLESIDELLRHGLQIPSLDDFSSIVLVAETSEELPSHDYVRRVFRAFGERGILERVRGVLVGRPASWSFEKPQSEQQRREYRQGQREAILACIRKYNSSIPVVQNIDVGHTSPQIPIPLGKDVRINAQERRIFAQF